MSLTVGRITPLSDSGSTGAQQRRRELKAEVDAETATAKERDEQSASRDERTDGQLQGSDRQTSAHDRVIEGRRRSMGDELELAFGNLLARINRDGGHRQATFVSITYAGKDAEATVIALRVDAERNDVPSSSGDDPAAGTLADGHEFEFDVCRHCGRKSFSMVTRFGPCPARAESQPHHGEPRPAPPSDNGSTGAQLTCSRCAGSGIGPSYAENTDLVCAQCSPSSSRDDPAAGTSNPLAVCTCSFPFADPKHCAVHRQPPQAESETTARDIDSLRRAYAQAPGGSTFPIDPGVFLPTAPSTSGVETAQPTQAEPSASKVFDPRAMTRRLIGTEYDLDDSLVDYILRADLQAERERSHELVIQRADLQQDRAALRTERDQLRVDLQAERAIGAGRVHVLAEKSEALRLEWQRAENAEAERDAVQADAQRLKTWVDDYFPKRYAILSKQAAEERKGGGPFAGLVTGGMLNECQLTHELIDCALRSASDTGEKP